MMVSRGLAAVCLLCAGALACGAEAPSWPTVQPLQRTFDVPNVQQMNVVLLIRSKAGEPLYRLRCAHPGNSQDYSGDFECRFDTVGSGDVRVGQTLLIEDARQLKPWPSRGRFFTADLVGHCAAIPEFGATRDFRLRGMELTLQVLDPVVDTARQGFGGAGDPQLKSLKLKVTVHPAPAATRAIAAIVPFPKHPPPQCGINPGAWPVGALGNVLGYPLKDISYFGDPATFARGQPPTRVDWQSVPLSKPGEWNRGMEVGATPSNCSVRLGADTTFRGTLVAARFLIHDPRLHTKTNEYMRHDAILKLDHPIGVCSATPAPYMSTSEVVQQSRAYYRKHGLPIPTTAELYADVAAARKPNPQLPPTLLPAKHITAFDVDSIELLQLGAFNTKYIGHRVEIRALLTTGEDQQLAPYNLQYGIYGIGRICLLRQGKPTACSSDKRPL